MLPFFYSSTLSRGYNKIRCHVRGEISRFSSRRTDLALTDDQMGGEQDEGCVFGNFSDIKQVHHEVSRFPLLILHRIHYILVDSMRCPFDHIEAMKSVFLRNVSKKKKKKGNHITRVIYVKKGCSIDSQSFFNSSKIYKQIQIEK